MRWILVVLMLAALLLPGRAASKNSEVAGFGNGLRAEMNGLANAAVDAAIEATLEVNQDGGAGAGQRAAQSGVANFAIENEMSLLLAAILLAVLALMTFDKLLKYLLQRSRIKNDAMAMAARIGGRPQ